MTGAVFLLPREMTRAVKAALLQWAGVSVTTLILTLLLSGASCAETRLALVIGNAAYVHVPTLRNSVGDARGMRHQLAATGFDVIYREDADRRTMNRAVDEFVDRLTPDTVAVIYFAGHGVQIEASNYLLPTDIDADTAHDVATDALELGRLLEKVTATQARFSLAIIDACRDNPFRIASRALKNTRGLAPSTSAEGVMVVYSAGANQTALDRLSERDPDPNGVFTRIWMREMVTPGLSVQEVALRVRQSVALLARSVGHLQTPAVYDQSLGTFEFVEGGATANSPLPILPEKTQPATSAGTQAATTQVEAVRSAPPNDCDRLGQPPRTKMGKSAAFADGVSLASLEAPAALTACRRAMADWPNEPRFLAYAGRAASKAGDLRDALRLYRLAADRGNPLAQNNLGALYAEGQGGLIKNQAEAVRLYRLAADQGYPVAMSNLGSMYVSGSGGLPHDEHEAVRWWTLAVGQGDEDAQTNLGVMYAQGRGGLPRDTGKAAQLWRLAASRGEPIARRNLRKMTSSSETSQDR